MMRYLKGDVEGRKYMKSIHKIKTKLLLVILGVAFGFSIIIFVVTLSQLMLQKESIEERGYEEAKVVSEDTKRTLGELNRQVAKDFSSAGNQYFNQVFTNIRKHVVAVADETMALYQDGNANVQNKFTFGNKLSGFAQGGLVSAGEKACREVRGEI